MSNLFQAFQVRVFDYVPQPDNHVLVRVFCTPVDESRPCAMFDFLWHPDDKILAPRFVAFLKAIGAPAGADMDEHLEGRYFAARHDGEDPEDFVTLEEARKANLYLKYLQTGVEAYARQAA